MTIHFAIAKEEIAVRSIIATDDEGRVLYSRAQPLGPAIYSNHELAYRTLIAVLRWAREHSSEQGTICTDQELLYREIGGEWECNAIHLRLLRDEARALLEEMDARLLYIPIRENMQARLLCRMAAHQARVEMKGGQSVA